MSRRPVPRIVATGMGVVSAWGWGVEPFWRGLCSGRTAIGPLRRFAGEGHRTAIAAEVPGAEEVRSPRRQRSLADRFAVDAALEALAQAGLGVDLSGRAAGVFFGSSTGGMLECEEYYARLVVRSGRPDLRLLGSQQVSAPAEAVAARCRVHGPVETISSACASAALALGAALEALRRADVDVAVAGGADSLCRTTYGGFNALRSVDASPCLPFRKERAGLSLGEGGAVLVLERLDDALERGAVPLCELAGAGSSSDGYHMTAPHPDGEGASAALEAALADSGFDRHAIDFVNAHGTGTPLNDAAEWRALERVFGRRARELPVTATKASVGHWLGSAGAIEAVATALCLGEGLVHPTPGAGTIDDELPVRLVTGRPLALATLRAAVSLNLGFGGCNAALVLARWPGP